MPPKKPPLGQDKKAIEIFLWFVYLYKIDRRQMVELSERRPGADKCGAENKVAFLEGKSI
jgi:hypothetical protein